MVLNFSNFQYWSLYGWSLYNHIACILTSGSWWHQQWSRKLDRLCHQSGIGLALNPNHCKKSSFFSQMKRYISYEQSWSYVWHPEQTPFLANLSRIDSRILAGVPLWGEQNWSKWQSMNSSPSFAHKWSSHWIN